jgi:biotin carboxyl carrier protein
VKIRWKELERDVDPSAPTGPSGPSALRVVVAGGRAFVWRRGKSWELTAAEAAGVAGRRSGRARGDETAGGLLSPMPGTIRKVHVAEGDRVAKGQVLLVLEAMKMEHAIRAPHAGRVSRLAFAEGDLVDAGAELAQVAPDSESPL